MDTMLAACAAGAIQIAHRVFPDAEDSEEPGRSGSHQLCASSATVIVGAPPLVAVRVRHETTHTIQSPAVFATLTGKDRHPGAGWEPAARTAGVAYDADQWLTTETVNWPPPQCPR